VLTIYTPSVTIRMCAPRMKRVSVLCCVCLDAHTHVHMFSHSLTPLRTNEHKNKSISDVCNIKILTYVDVCMLKYADINFNSSHPPYRAFPQLSLELVSVGMTFLFHTGSPKGSFDSHSLSHGVCFTTTLISLL